MKGSMVDILQTVLDSVNQDVNDRIYEPIPPGDFYTSEYHCGMPRSMIPNFWLDEAVDFIEGGYNELIITGSLGAFKTTWANLILLYKMYELFSYRSIHAFFSLPKIQDIYNIYFNVNLTQAKLTGFNQLKNMIDESRWFTEEFPRNKQLNSIIEFARNPSFKFLSGSGHQHAIGMTIWSFILDEGDFFKKNGAGFDESYSFVTNMYNELIDRRKSRFQNGESDLSFSVLISSASFQSSFVEKRIAESAVDDKIKVVKAIHYKVVPEKHSAEKFVVFAGDALVDPELIEATPDFNNVLAKMGLTTRVDVNQSVMEAFKTLPPDLKLRFETPPVDLRDRFRKNLGKSLQNFCGVYIASEGKLFQSKALLFSAYKENLVHPFSKKKVELSTGDTVQLKDYFTPQLLKHIERPHAIHIDGSVTGDSTGISMVRYDGMVDNQKKYTHVFSLEILPPPAPFRIKLSKIRDFVIYMKNILGVNIVKVTQDGYQCLNEDTWVPTDKGIIRLHEVKEGDFVWSRSGRKKVKKVFRYGKQETIKFITNHKYEIEGTDKHRILVSDGWEWEKGIGHVMRYDWRLFKDIKKGDYVYLQEDLNDFEYTYQDVPKIVEYENAGRSIDSFNLNFKQPEYFNEELARFYGYAVGDGEFGKDGIRITVGSEQELQYVETLFEKAFGYVRKGKMSCPTVGSFHVDAYGIGNFGDELGFKYCKAPEKDIPDIVMKSPKSVKAAFLSGLFSADGSIRGDWDSGEGGIRFTSSSKVLIEKVRVLLLLDFGIKTNTHYIQREGYTEICGNACYAHDLYHLDIFGKGGCNRYAAAVNNHVGYKQEALDKLNRPFGRNIQERVTHITVGSCSVIDLEVEDDPSYIANGFMSHNSEDALQIMADNGLNVAKLSIDSTDKPYLVWIGLLVDECMSMYKYEVLEEEAFAAIHFIRKKKVDHPKGEGSPNINVLQSFVGALYNLVMMDSADMVGTEYNVDLGQLREETKEDVMNAIMGNPTFVTDYMSHVRKNGIKRNVYGIILDS